jgi:hypothetical protein
MEWRDAVWILGVLLVGVLLVVPWGLLYDWIREETKSFRKDVV